MNLRRRPQLQEFLRPCQLRQAVRCVVIVHGDCTSGVQRVAHRFCPGSVQGVHTAHRHQRSVHGTDLPQLRRSQLVAQISQMGYRHASRREDADDVFAPQSAVPIVVEGLHLPHRKGGFRLRQQRHAVYGVVVKMAVAAKNCVGAHL